jgi:hypothetical protein
MRFCLLFLVLNAWAFAQQQPSVVPPAAQKSAHMHSGSPASPELAVPGMSPSVAYQYAMQPFVNARSASNDLTDADEWALGIGMARAKKQCDLLSKQKMQGEALLALGKLCILGQDFEPAREALISYLELPKLKSPEVAHLLLAKAFLGLHWVTSAESQMDSLLSLYPYDASIALGIDMVVDAAEASDSTMDRGAIGRLDEQQLPHTLAALAHGGSLSGNGDSVNAAMLVREALRCADRLRRRGQFAAAQKIVEEVKTSVEAPAIADSAYAPAIQDALTRYRLYGQSRPVRELRGSELPVTGKPFARRVLLFDPDPAAHRTVLRSGKNMIIRMSDDRTLVLVFSLAGPASAATIQSIVKGLAKDRVTPGLKVFAATSYAANIGDDTPNPQVLRYLQHLRGQLPRTLPVLLVPNTELAPFAIDMWPAAILFDGSGRILWLHALSGSRGSIRKLEWDIENPVPLPPGN